MGIRFGEFVLEAESRELLRAGQQVRLGPKAFELIEFLVSRRPRALSKAQIRDRLWPRNTVSESTLVSVVSELRSALGDDARRPRFVRTVYGFGYAFCGEASEVRGARARGAPRGPRLLWAELEFLLSEGDNILGRDDEAAARIDAPTVSRCHARIVVSAGGAVLEDLGSKNGTFLRGERLAEPRALQDGDEVRLGRIPLIFKASGAHPSTATEASE